MLKSRDFKVDKRTILIGYITQFFQYGSSIIVLPFILHNLSEETMGVWYLFLSVMSLCLLLDFGFSASLSRNISFVFSGVKELIKDGTPQNSSVHAINYSLLNSLLYTSKKVYGRISIIIVFLLLTGGSLYIYSIIEDIHVLYIWLFYACSVSFNYYYNYINVFIRGRGLISLNNRLIIISKSFFLFIVFLLVKMDFGLWALVIANFISTFLFASLGKYYFYDAELRKNLATVNERENLFPVIWYNAKKFGFSSFTNYAFSQANILLGGILLGVSDVAKLGLILQISSIIVTICRVYFVSYYPKICSLWVIGDISQIRKIFVKSQIVGYLFWFLGFIFVTIFGDTCLELIQSQTSLPEKAVIILYAFFYLMELTHGNCSMLISSRNTVPFLRASIFACITSLVLVFVFSKLGMGLYAFPLSMICANLPYNSWKWTYEAYKLLKERK